MNRYIVKHTTTYRYARPVRFNRHRLMLRPRDSHDVRLVSAALSISVCCKVHWIHDVFGNSIALADFPEDARDDTLEIVSELTLERFVRSRDAVDIEPEALLYPFVYNSDDRIDLGRMTECHFESSVPVLAEWLAPFTATRDIATFDLLSKLNAHIGTALTYEARHARGTQSPQKTIESGRGTCRDFALLMIEAARYLGMGARFISGYLYDAAADGDTMGIRGARSTHAWAEIYLPGPGWVEFDPTNDLIDSPRLIRIATTRDPSQAIPVSGSFIGRRGDFRRLDVDVTVVDADKRRTT